ncbi:MAG: protease modulator HflC [Bauldia sp.]
MKRFFGSAGLVIAAGLALIGYLGFFIIDPTEQGLVLRFGQAVRAVTSPGLYFKVPFIDNVVYIQKQILALDNPPIEVNAADQKRLVVDAFARYKIVDPLRFYQAAGTEAVAESRLSSFLRSSVPRVLGAANFIEIVRDRRADLMQLITQRLDEDARDLGIQVVDVRIRHADLPEANSQAIYQRMQTERQRQATEIRAEGNQAAQTIQAEADRQVTVIIAEANRQSEQTRGDGDAAVTKTFADAYGRDPEFFAFYRSMLAYQTGLRDADTKLVLTPTSRFFRFFNDPFGAVGAEDNGAAAAPAPASGAGAPAR